MMITKVAGIVFACAGTNHLGLVSAIEKTLGIKLPIINCVKCSTFWFVLAYCLLSGVCVIYSLATSLFAAYAALWIELLMGYIDKIFVTLYDKIYTTEGTADVPHPSDGDESDT